MLTSRSMPATRSQSHTVSDELSSSSGHRGDDEYSIGDSWEREEVSAADESDKNSDSTVPSGSLEGREYDVEEEHHLFVANWAVDRATDLV